MAAIPRRHFQIHFLERKSMNFDNISLKCVPKGQINNIPALVQIMAWHRQGDKPLSEPGLEGFGRHPVFTTVFTGKYRPGKNRFWTPKVGKTGKNTTLLFKQFHISIKSLI